MDKVLLLLLVCSGCHVGTSLDFERDPVTGAIVKVDFDRDWLGGPVSIELVLPDGTTLKWVSDVELDQAVAREMLWRDLAVEALTRAAQTATTIGNVP